MANASLVYSRVLSNLNDPNATWWNEALIFPFIRQAHDELTVALWKNGVDVLKEISSILTIDAGVTELESSRIMNLVEPISVGERPVGTTDTFLDLTEVDFIPITEASETLGLWAWNGEVIKFHPSTEDREIIVRYTKRLNHLADLNSPIGFIFGETFLIPKVTAAAAASVGDNQTLALYGPQAGRSLHDIISANIKSAQDKVVRERPYRDRFGAGFNPSRRRGF